MPSEKVHTHTHTHTHTQVVVWRVSVSEGVCVQAVADQ